MTESVENPLDKMKASFITVGCRANQADTARMLSSLPLNIEAVDYNSPDCDIVFINTCTVTSQADADGRNLVRRARKKHPQSRIVVTGCSASVDPAPWEKMPEVDHVISLAERDDLASWLHAPGIGTEHIIDPEETGVAGPTPLSGHKSRPFVKIQDGCTRGCTYCIVPKARGGERSRKLELILDDIYRLVDAGYPEIVLTGVHLGRWGWDHDMDFRDLISSLDKIPSGSRIRFSSIEPMDLDRDLVKEIISHPKVCPHLHIPLQSGDNEILRRMARAHNVKHYEEIVRAAIETNPDIAIGTDIMVGFPGENDELYKNSFNFVKSIPFSYLHVFRYSPRKNTPAASMPGRADGVDVKNRMKDFKRLDKDLRKAYKQRFHGQVLPCLIEIPTENDTRINALSDNYIRLELSESRLNSGIGKILPLRIDTNNVRNGTEFPRGIVINNS
ncbi:MAG TPA: tRNA (N(6)-L-threonylcarbamoyladenosine(37)-C(2))-methylthiotransferase MtaB [bacterium]|jgi:threonylcarbamoyladenosine tRNA methylthiotransferase MtaB